MHKRAAVVAALSVLVLCAQTPHDPDITRTQSELAHVQDLVEAGAASRAQLESARQSVAEAEENAFLRRTLYGNDATESDIEQMVAVTERRLDRRRDAVAKMEGLVDAGVASRLSLTDVLEQEDRARKEHDYAVTRVRRIRE